MSEKVRDYRVGLAVRQATTRVVRRGETPREAVEAVTGDSTRLDLGPGERADAETAVSEATVSVLERVADRLDRRRRA